MDKFRAALLSPIFAKAPARSICQNEPQTWLDRCGVDRDPTCMRILEGEHHVGRHQHDLPLFLGTLVDIRLEPGASVQDEVAIFYATAILSAPGTLDQRSKDIRPDRSAAPLALAV